MQRTSYTIRKKQSRRINLIIDIQNCIKAQESKGYIPGYPAKSKTLWGEEKQRSEPIIRRKADLRKADLRKAEFVTTRAKINNLKQAAKTLNFLTELNLTTYEDLEKVAEQKQKNFTDISDKIKSVEKEINTAAMLIKNIETYSRLKPIMQKRKSAKDKDRFDNKHRSKIILFEAALNELKSADFPPIKELKTKYNLLTEQKEKLYAEYKKAKAEATEIDIVKSNANSLLGTSHKPSRDISAHLEQ